jgi:hypothetical protein
MQDTHIQLDGRLAALTAKAKRLEGLESAEQRLRHMIKAHHSLSTVTSLIATADSVVQSEFLVFFKNLFSFSSLGM